MVIKNSQSAERIRYVDDFNPTKGCNRFLIRHLHVHCHVRVDDRVTTSLRAGKAVPLNFQYIRRIIIKRGT